MLPKLWASSATINALPCIFFSSSCTLVSLYEAFVVMKKKYGRLDDNWQEQIKKGFDECMRVLKTEGILIFKWNENQISLSEVLEVIQTKPLFGHTSGRSGATKWLCFMK